MAQKKKKKKTCPLPRAGIPIISTVNRSIPSATPTSASASGDAEPPARSIITAPTHAHAVQPSKRKHPCIANFGQCRYGEFCVFRDMPANVCMHHYFSRCEFGAKCVRLHEVDGQSLHDIRSAMTAAAGQDEACAAPSWKPLCQGAQPYGETSYTLSLIAPKLQLAISNQAAQLPLACVRHAHEMHMQSDAVCTDKIDDDDDDCYYMRTADTALTHTRALPAPYRAALLSHSAQVVTTAELLPQRAGRGGGRCCTNVYAAHALTRDKRPSRYDGDSLAGFYEQTVQLGKEAASAALVQHGHGHEGEGGGRHAVYDSDTISEECSTEEEGKDDLYGEYEEDDTDMISSHGCSPNHSAEGCSDAELTALMKLIELFPQEDPVNILQVLRMHRAEERDAAETAAVNTLLEVQRMDDATCDAALARALAEEEEAANEDGGGATDNGGPEPGGVWPYAESLESLQLLFPNEPLSHIAAALRQLDNNYQAAFELLLCATQDSDHTEATHTETHVPHTLAMHSDNNNNNNNNNVVHSNHDDNSSYVSAVRGESSHSHGRRLREVVLHTLQARAQRRARRGERLLSSGCIAVTRASLDPHHRHHHRARIHAASHETQSSSPQCVTPPGSESVATSEEVLREYRAVEKEVRRLGDWRSVRQAAYRVNHMRLCTVERAKQAYHAGCPAAVQRLNAEARRLEAEYIRLNRIALLALEQERLAHDPSSTLDLHYVHMDEVRELLYRRVRMCQRRRVARLNVVVGEGHHSKDGVVKIAPQVKKCLTTDPVLQRSATMISVQPGIIRVRIHFTHETSLS